MSAPRLLDLSGRWQAAVLADDGTRLAAPEPDFDDSGWHSLPVPGHWRRSPHFATNDEPVTYRTRFRVDPPGEGERSFLELPGIIAASDVWLDGIYLGDTSGASVPHSFEITSFVRTDGRVPVADEHVLTIEAGFEPVGTRATRDLSGAFGRSALLGDGHNPGGISKPVSVRTTGPVRIAHSRLRCLSADASSATLLVRVVIDADEARTVTIRTRVEGPRSSIDPSRREFEIEREHPLAAGENRIEFTVTVSDPSLWWPRTLGDQPLYDVDLVVLADDEPSDRCGWRTGLRTVEMTDFITSINGRRLFLKGIALAPTSLHPADTPTDEVLADLHRAADAGVDFVRIHGHIAHDALYDEADRLGILIWQDLPLQWTHQRSVAKAARRVARAAADQLAHHPSVFVWNAHHEPWAGDPRSWRSGGADARGRHRLRMLAAQILPSWNRTLLDRSVSETLEASDGTRPVLAHSGVWPHLPQLSGTASHLWPGWRWGTARDLGRLLHWWPRLGRFVAEFGAQAPGEDLSIFRSENDLDDTTGTDDVIWPALDWPAISRRTALELPSMRDQVPPGAFADLTEWAQATRDHQAEVIRSHIETLRRLKYRPTGGFAAFALADPAPGVTAALHSHDRSPKPAWAAFTEACAPIIVVTDAPPATVRRGQRFDLDVHVVNDLHRDLDQMKVTMTVSIEGSDRLVARTGWTGAAPADEVVKVATASIVVPTGAPEVTELGWLRIETVLTGADGLRQTRIHRRPITR